MLQWISFGTRAGVSIGEGTPFTTVLCYGSLGNGCLVTACLILRGLQVSHNWGLALYVVIGVSGLQRLPRGPKGRNFGLCSEDTLTFWFFLTFGLSHRLDCLPLVLPLANSSSLQPKCHLLRDFPVSAKWYCFPLSLILIAPWTLPLWDLQ